jgi:thioredoxin-related protein
MKGFPDCMIPYLVLMAVISYSFQGAEARLLPVKNKLLIFTGSDWCPNCKRLEKKILRDSAFISFARDWITLEYADFPQKKKLEQQVIEKNRLLAEKYHFQGVYPTILLLDSAGKIKSEIFYSNQDATEFITRLKLALQPKNP